MFNLIVSFNGWQPNSDSFGVGRLLEYTDSDLVQRFMPNNVFDFTAVSRLPTLFMAETQGAGDQLAYVGTITDIKLVGTQFKIEYAFDADIPPIPNSSLAKMARELEIDDFEFCRTHWAIKNVNLYKVLLRNLSQELPSPKLFRVVSTPASKGLVSAMMPFHPKFDGVYAALQRAAEIEGKKCRRADNIWEHDAIIQDVVSLICKSSIVICDLTDRNANVFYETGIAHTLGKDVILISQSANDVPFDFQHLRYIHYLNNNEGLERLAEKVAERIATLSDRN